MTEWNAFVAEVDDIVSAKPIWRPSDLHLHRRRSHCY